MEETRIVKIEWVDPHSVDEWTDIKDHDWNLTKTVVSIGRVIKETSNAFVLTLCYAKDDETSCCNMVIPKTCIVKVETYHGTKRRR